jgi:hypothetical protein
MATLSATKQRDIRIYIVLKGKGIHEEKLVVIAYVPPFAAMWDLILIRIM